MSVEVLTDEAAVNMWAAALSTSPQPQKMKQVMGNPLPPLADIEDEEVDEEEPKGTADKPKEPEKVKDKAEPPKVDDADKDNPQPSEEEIDKALRGEDEPDEAKSKGGRKPSDFVNMVNKLVSKEVLFGYEGGEVKTVDEAERLIKDNLAEVRKEAFEDQWIEKVKSYSPQVQTILHFAEQGAQTASDLMNLMGAIQEVEQAGDLSVDDEVGQEQVVREMLRSRGFKDNYIDKQLKTMKDLGTLKENAEEFLPELQDLRNEQVQQILEQQQVAQQRAEQVRRTYTGNIKTVLDKDNVGGIQMAREDKFKVYDALAAPKYNSIGGIPVNGFVKTLEDLQFGDKPNYDHFVNIVHYTIDPKGFLEKLARGIKNSAAEETYSKLKTSKTTTANYDGAPASQTPKKVIQKATFNNPYK